MANNPFSSATVLIFMLLGAICLVILTQDYVADNKEPVEEYNCSETLQYAQYNHTTKEVTYLNSEHKLCNKIISKQ